MRRAPEIPSVEFECSAAEKLATDRNGLITTVRLYLAEEKRAVDVPAGEIDEVRTDREGRAFALVFRRALETLALAERIGPAERAEATDERTESRDVTKPLEFEEVRPVATGVTSGR